MATFTCYVPTNNFGNGFPPSFTFPFGDGSVFELDFPEFYELYGGSFGYYGNGVPFGQVTSYSVYNYSDVLTRYWTADGGIYDATDIFNLRDTGSWRDFFEYMFYLNDNIYGSSGRDKLNGYRGNDYIDAGQGNDKVKGGPGFDVFYFDRFDGRDTILGFSVRKDSIWLDLSLAQDMGDVFAAAFTYRRGVVLDFGSEVIKIKGLAPDKLDDVNFDFVV